MLPKCSVMMLIAHTENSFTLMLTSGLLRPTYKGCAQGGSFIFYDLSFGVNKIF